MLATKGGLSATWAGRHGANTGDRSLVVTGSGVGCVGLSKPRGGSIDYSNILLLLLV